MYLKALVIKKISIADVNCKYNSYIVTKEFGLKTKPQTK